jgi:hypothetical protein
MASGLAAISLGLAAIFLALAAIFPGLSRQSFVLRLTV